MQVQAEDKPYDDINITPMLDLAYVLLVIFILMMTASVAGTKVNLPVGGVATRNLALPKTKAVTINAEGTVFLDTIPMGSMDELRDRLAQIKANVPEFPVVIRGDADAQYQSIMDVMNVIGGLGITQVGLATKAANAK